MDDLKTLEIVYSATPVSMSDVKAEDFHLARTIEEFKALHIVLTYEGNTFPLSSYLWCQKVGPMQVASFAETSIRTAKSGSMITALLNSPTNVKEWHVTLGLDPKVWKTGECFVTPEHYEEAQCAAATRKQAAAEEEEAKALIRRRPEDEDFYRPRRRDDRRERGFGEDRDERRRSRRLVVVLWPLFFTS